MFHSKQDVTTKFQPLTFENLKKLSMTFLGDCAPASRYLRLDVCGGKKSFLEHTCRLTCCHGLCAVVLEFMEGCSDFGEEDSPDILS